MYLPISLTTPDVLFFHFFFVFSPKSHQAGLSLAQLSSAAPCGAARYRMVRCYAALRFVWYMQFKVSCEVPRTTGPGMHVVCPSSLSSLIVLFFVLLIYGLERPVIIRIWDHLDGFHMIRLAFYLRER